MDSIDRSLLPPQIRILLDTVGVEDALSLLRGWGGQRRWIPERPELASVELRALVSAQGLQALCASRFGGQSTDWPKADKCLRQAIHAAMRADRQAGATANELAARYGYTTRRVRQIAPSQPAESGKIQPDLFD